ncbi:MAG: hypothetical protein JXR97_05000, partial [Planctomycetes bacterium]|nr:hypothetical protein [Planctomycetota bacterium]
MPTSKTEINTLAASLLFLTAFILATVYLLAESHGGESKTKPGVALEKPGFLWWEAEVNRSNTFPASRAFAPNTPAEKDVLSGGDWLQTDKGAGATAAWDINLIEGGTYHFWTRKFWLHGPFKWAFNDQAQQTCTRKCTLVDSVSIRKFVGANWVYLGEVTLPKGKNVLKIEALPDTTAIAFDCWVLSKTRFTPNGNKKPGEKYNRTEPGWFAFEPDEDDFSNKALFDLRGMNEDRAGESGYV